MAINITLELDIETRVTDSLVDQIAEKAARILHNFCR